MRSGVIYVYKPRADISSPLVHLTAKEDGCVYVLVTAEGQAGEMGTSAQVELPPEEVRRMLAAFTS